MADRTAARLDGDAGLELLRTMWRIRVFEERVGELTPAHEGHGHAIAKGASLERVMAELMGRADGLCGGLGGSMHLVDVEHGLLGATGVVGGHGPLPLGRGPPGRRPGGAAGG